MELLFKREQTLGRLRRVRFKLWGKIELDDEEKELLKRYRLDNAVMIQAEQEHLFRNTVIAGVAIFLIVFALLAMGLGMVLAFLLSVFAGGGGAFWYFTEKRETILVKDLLHGRYFSCVSVVELIRKEAWLENAAGYLRQLLESAKHWGGTEQRKVRPLPVEEARRFVL